MAYCQLLKVEEQVQIKGSAEQYLDIFCNKTHHISNLCPEIRSVEIHKGEWGSEGSILCWNFIHEGKVAMAKALVETIDHERNKVIHKVTEGDILKNYKSFTWILQVTPQKKGCIVTWTLEYEKRNNHVPDPQFLLQLAIKMSKDIDAHLTNTKKM